MALSSKNRTRAIIALALALVTAYVWYARTYAPRKAALEYAARDMIDPSSVQFRDVRKGKLSNYCGEINGKNRFGAYVGFRRFYGDGSSGMIEPDEPRYDDSEVRMMLRSNFETLYNISCD